MVSLVSLLRSSFWEVGAMPDDNAVDNVKRSRLGMVIDAGKVEPEYSLI